MIINIERERRIWVAALKYSRQREAIKNYLTGREDHPTADMVYTAIRKIYPNISLGTVYRNLTLLADQGEIMKISCGESRQIPSFSQYSSSANISYPNILHSNPLRRFTT